jgi:hypothetical protein
VTRELACLESPHLWICAPTASTGRPGPYVAASVKAFSRVSRYDSSMLSTSPVRSKHLSGAKLAFCVWAAHFPTTGGVLSLSTSTGKCMVWLPVAIFEHHEERGSVYAPLTSFHETLYVLFAPVTNVVSVKLCSISRAHQSQRPVSDSYGLFVYSYCLSLILDPLSPLRWPRIYSLDLKSQLSSQNITTSVHPIPQPWLLLRQIRTVTFSPTLRLQQSLTKDTGQKQTLPSP